MKKIELNHWIVNDNNLSISLMHYHVTIKVLKNDERILFQLEVIDSKRNKLVFNFYTLEAAMSFTENVVSKCSSNIEVANTYIEMFSNDEFLSYDENCKKILSVNEVDNIILNYFFGNSEDDRFYIKKELIIKDEKLVIKFYLASKQNKENIIRLSDEELKNILSSYVKSDGYELLDYRFIGGIHKAGYSFDNDTPHFNGIELSVKKEEKELKKTN